VLRGNREGMPQICEDMLGNRPRGSSCFLLAGDPVGNAPIGSPLLFQHFPKCIRYAVNITKKVSNNLQAFLKEYCSNYLQELFDALLKVGIDLSIFFTFSLKLEN
jgi:hypothetical protein